MLVLGGLYAGSNHNVQAAQDGCPTQFSVWLLGAVSHVSASDAATCQTASTAGHYQLYFVYVGVGIALQ